VTSEVHNQLLDLLPRRDRQPLMALREPGDSLRHLHFPLDVFLSMLAAQGEHSVIEVGMVGREGMLGVHVVLGVAQAPLRALVQGAGTSLCIAAPPFDSNSSAARPCRRCGCATPTSACSRWCRRQWACP
jgi:hypothetical protein